MKSFSGPVSQEENVDIFSRFCLSERNCAEWPQIARFTSPTLSRAVLQKANYGYHRLLPNKFPGGGPEQTIAWLLTFFADV